MASETVIQPLEDVLGSVSVSGGWGAILKTTGIDIKEFPCVMDGSGSAVVMHNGHQWTVKPWEGGGGFAMASRLRTEEETKRDEQRMLRNTFVSHFTKDRLLMCMDIAEHVRKLSSQIHPDHPPARAARRSVQRKLNRLAQIQTALLLHRTADSSLYEQELKQLRSA